MSPNTTASSVIDARAAAATTSNLDGAHSVVAGPAANINNPPPDRASDLAFPDATSNQAPICQKQSRVPPFQRITGKNLIPDPNISDPSGWDLQFGAKIDHRFSRTPGSGSLDLSKPGAQAYTELIPVEPGKTYHISAYLYTSVWPATGFMMFISYDTDKKVVRQNFSNGGYFGTTEPGKWQEINHAFSPGPNEAYYVIDFGRWGAGQSPRLDGTFFIDDIVLSESPGFQSPPTKKVAFDGTEVQIDELGNYFVNESGSMKPYFPFCIYSNIPTRMQLYSNQGFNCYIYNNFQPEVMAALKSSASKYNPKGMRSWIDISGYMARVSWTTIDDLKAKAPPYLTAENAKHLLGFHWDNESPGEHDLPIEIVEYLRKVDESVNGKRRLPMFMNQGSAAISRVHHGLIDSVGAYVNSTLPESSVPLIQGLWSGLEKAEGQNRPLGLGVLSETYSREAIRMEVYTALIVGAKGVSYFVDGQCFSHIYQGPSGGPGCTDLSLRTSWQEIPILREEIERLVPLIQQPHWTSWTAESSKKEVVIGTRELDCSGYLILLNTSTASQAVEVRLGGLTYEPRSLRDYFSGEQRATVSEGKAQVNLNANQTLVLKIDGR